MKKMFLLSILTVIILLAGACKSSPDSAERTRRTREPAASSEHIPVAAIPEQQVPIREPETATVATQPPRIVEEGSYTRLQSGIIMDGATTYTVRSGDTLAGIARQMYQDGSLYPLIMMGSTEITDPDQILPGMRLTIPSLRANMNDPSARAGINRYFLQIAQIEEQRGRHATAALIRNHTR
jgi:LysM repeat protein